MRLYSDDEGRRSLRTVSQAVTSFESNKSQLFKNNALATRHIVLAIGFVR
ncbi:hypothetical protein FHT28_005543 [Rhizobium sp. SG570]|nr:hypothetical protein [Rhizobium sp. SG570]